MRKDNRLGFDLQVTVLRQDVELMHPIAERVTIRRASRNRIGDEAERQAALRFVVNRAQADLVVALRHRAVVAKFRSVLQMITVHASTA